MSFEKDFERVNDLQQYHDRLLIYSESDVYEVSKEELIAMSTTTIHSVASDMATSPTYDLQGRKVVNPKHGIYIINKQKVVK
jgi:ribosome-associated toxin RatA of RatAB toxin-antitoxin module